MPDTPADLLPATPDDVKDALSFALRFDGRKHYPRANEFMADIVAEHLLAHLERCGFVIMKKPGLACASVAAGVRITKKGAGLGATSALEVSQDSTLPFTPIARQDKRFGIRFESFPDSVARRSLSATYPK